MSDKQLLPNIYVIGPQCTGKTTIVTRLRSDVDAWLAGTSLDRPNFVSEVARSAMTKNNFSARDITASKEKCLMVRTTILQAQATAEDEALHTSSWFISDRSGLDPLVYAKMFAGSEATQDLQATSAWKTLRQNGWLCYYNEWIGLFNVFLQVLKHNELPYHIVPCTMEDLTERINFIHEKWRETIGPL
ncbi:AAA domain-containing protein, partial [Stachybotrys elegans]